MSEFDDVTLLQVLDAPVDARGLEAMTVRQYLTRLLADVWQWREMFDGKRPFGNSGWQFDLYRALARADLIDAGFDEDGYLHILSDEDVIKADKLIAAAIQYLGARTC